MPAHATTVVETPVDTWRDHALRFKKNKYPVCTDRNVPKMFFVGLFVVVGLVSVVPTLKYLRWRREHRASGALPGPLEIRRARSWVAAQAGLLAALPLLAALMARGLGL